MSGGPSDRGVPGGPTATDCTIIEVTPLNSPKAGVVATLAIGDSLEVEFDASGTAVVAKKGPSIAGSLTPFRLAELVECMQRGRKYKAIVKKITGGYCEVEIRPK